MKTKLLPLLMLTSIALPALALAEVTGTNTNGTLNTDASTPNTSQGIGNSPAAASPQKPRQRKQGTSKKENHKVEKSVGTVPSNSTTETPRPSDINNPMPGSPNGMGNTGTPSTSNNPTTTGGTTGGTSAGTSGTSGGR